MSIRVRHDSMGYLDVWQLVRVVVNGASPFASLIVEHVETGVRWQCATNEKGRAELALALQGLPGRPNLLLVEGVPLAVDDAVTWDHGVVHLTSSVKLTNGTHWVIAPGSQLIVEKDVDIEVGPGCSFSVLGSAEGARDAGGSRRLGRIQVQQGTLRLAHIEIARAVCSGHGGAIRALNNSAVWLSHVDITDCEGEDGGALYLEDSTLVGAHVRLEGNEARGRGGGLAALGSWVELEHSWWSGMWPEVTVAGLPRCEAGWCSAM